MNGICTTMYLLYMGYIGNIRDYSGYPHFPCETGVVFSTADDLGCQALPPIERLFRVSPVTVEALAWLKWGVGSHSLCNWMIFRICLCWWVVCVRIVPGEKKPWKNGESQSKSLFSTGILGEVKWHPRLCSPTILHLEVQIPSSKSDVLHRS